MTKVIKTFENDLHEEGLNALKPLERVNLTDGMALPDEVKQVVANRNGSILSASTILKSDFFSNLQKMSLPECVYDIFLILLDPFIVCLFSGASKALLISDVFHLCCNWIRLHKRQDLYTSRKLMERWSVEGTRSKKSDYMRTVYTGLTSGMPTVQGCVPHLH